MLCLLLWGGLWLGRTHAQGQLESAQRNWVCASQRIGYERLLVDLQTQGATIRESQGQTEIIYQGTGARWREMINALIDFPKPWQQWQTRVDSDQHVEGRVLL
jgi:hypothetical protein